MSELNAGNVQNLLKTSFKYLQMEINAGQWVTLASTNILLLKLLI